MAKGLSSFIEELEWRGLIHQITPNAKAYLEKNAAVGYIGFDPTANSLHIGNLLQIILLKHFQRAGHTPVILIGGATAMIGDPSGKTKERKLLDEQQVKKNARSLEIQLKKFLDFDSGKPNAAIIVNNIDWTKKIDLISFLRSIGKHLTINYMMAKETIKKRLNDEDNAGISFTEFSYQLLQSLDFLTLHKKFDCSLQMGGSDQWGNITSGIELIRRKTGNKAHAITCPLLTKSDGSKFGKSSGGNVWLDAQRTSAYQLYQFWLNCTDAEALKYLKIFTLLQKEEIDLLALQHSKKPQLRLLQKTLSDYLTTLIHSEEEVKQAKLTSQILFGDATSGAIASLDKKKFDEVFEGINIKEIDKKLLSHGIEVAQLLCQTSLCASLSEARRLIKQKAISVNKEKIDLIYKITTRDIIAHDCIVLQRGKKNHALVKVVS